MIYILAAKAPVLMFVAIFIIAIGIILTYMVFTRTDLEYEYSFYDGEMRIDKIMHKVHVRNFTHSISARWILWHRKVRIILAEW